MNKSTLFVYLLLAAFLGGAASLVGYALLNDNMMVAQSDSSKPLFIQTGSSNLSTNGNPLDFRTAAASATPAVVSVKVAGSHPGANPHAKMLEEMFKDFFDKNNPQNQENQDQYMGSGSGVIFSKDGYIVTNNHVIEGASHIKIVMHDKTEYTAKLIGADPNTDLAVLKIEKNDLPAIILGNSDNIAVGEWVLAIGNPFDLSSTVTAGIVSAKSRNIRILENEDGFSVESFIQTDAAVNPGNSGGALINLNGELVGINTAIATQTGGFSGYSFAVPINLAQKIMRDIIEFGTVQRAILGVRIKDLTPEIVQSAGLTSFSGVFVVYVGGESLAKDAGIQEGDVIVAINDTAVNSTAQLQEFVARKRPGDKIKLSYYRNKMLKHANATLKNRMEGNDMAVKGGALHFPILGAYISELKIEEKNVLGIQNGVKVSRISKGKLMDAGMPEGFVITHVDKQGVSSVEDFETALHGKKGGVLFEGLSKDGNKLYFAIGL